MLSWIDEDAFEDALQTLVKELEDAKSKSNKRRRKNVVDPFWTLFVASTFEVEMREELGSLQRFESAVRGMSNAVGKFHQTVLGSVQGWVNHDTGYDLKNSDQMVIAEVKNKWNTLNAQSKDSAIKNLDTIVGSLKGSWKAYLVQIVPKTPERYERRVAKSVFEIDGASFYELVTNNPNAIHELFDALNSRLAPSDEIATYCQHILNQSLPPRI